MEYFQQLIQALNDCGIEGKYLTPFLIFSLEIIRSFISNSQEKESKTKTVFEIGNFIRYEKSKKRKK